MDSWDFDAPKFVDFTQPEEYEDQYDDKWFDTHTEEDDLVPVSKDCDDDAKSLHSRQPQRVRRTGSTCNRPNENDTAEQIGASARSPRLHAKLVRALVAEKHTAQTSIKNICPSPNKRQKMSADNHPVADSSSSSAAHNQQQTATSLDHSSIQTLSVDCPASNTRSCTPKKVTDSLADTTKLQTPKKENDLPAGLAKSQSPRKRALACEPHNGSGPFKESRSLRTMTKDGNTSSSNVVKARKPGVMRSQSLRSNLGAGIETKGKTTEELELEKISAMKREQAKTRKLVQESYKKAMSNHVYIPMRSVQPATLAVGFQFKTDERIKNPLIPNQEQKIKDFTKSLRETLPQQALPSKPQVHGLTRPKPFQLTSSKKVNTPPRSEQFKSVAEQVAAFHKKTPTRFHTHGSKERPSGRGRRARSQSPQLTIAKTPNLVTRGRTRPVQIPTREEQEQMEFEEHQKQQFKAHPVNPKVFGAPCIPKVPPRPITAIEEFNLQSQKSVSSVDLTGSEKEEEERYEFRARPVNPKILAGTVGVKPVEPKPVTIAESPAFALKNRIRVPVDMPVTEETKEPIKINPVPFTGIPFRPRLAHHCTVPEPFTVEERCRAMLTRREQKIQQILEEEKKAHDFHAQLLPSDSPDQLPPKQTKPATQPEPFHLEVDERGEKYKREFMFKLEEEERIAREIANFKARPNEVIHKEPFHPQKSAKPLTERINFSLNTDIRASQREAFDQHLKAREAELEALKRQREERLEKEEKAAVARIRMEAIHKASEIKRYKGVSVKPSDKPLTTAQSPRFSQRTRSKHNNSDL